MQNTKKPSLIRRLWRWFVYCLLTLLIVLMIPVAYFAWKVIGVWGELTSFQPLHMLAAQYTPKDVVGDLGGMKVRIPKGCAEYVEYDGDPGWGEKRKGAFPERTFASKLRSFGVDFRLADMQCADNLALRKDSNSYGRAWASIGITAGSYYPGLGAKATTNLAKSVTDSIVKPRQFWRSNYEQLPERVYGLDGYVVTGIDPNTGKPARKMEDDIYIHYLSPDFADTYIRCSKAKVLGAIGTCSMDFSMEPKARVSVDVRFERPLLPEWREIRQKTIAMLTSFEVHEGAAAHPP